MRQVDVELAGHGYPILIGSGLLADIDTHLAPLRPSTVLIVSDPAVAAHYGEIVRQRCERVGRTATVLVADGEAGKTMRAVEAVIDAAVAARADRHSVFVALGGGVVGDIAGFAAAIFMRGVRFVQVPTTLLAQVDSSVGGKTGVNHPDGKNLIGAFHQPQCVVADLDVLRTLPERELSAGLAEIIKHGLLADAAYLSQVERDMAQLRACDGQRLMIAVERSCEIKAGVVARDERESGERALLNLGHTFGHAIEALTGFGHWLHGEAVGCGLCLAGDLSCRLGLISRDDVAHIESVVAAAGLPVRIEGLDRQAAIHAMRGDKKAHGGRIGFIVLERIGKARQQQVPDDLLNETLAAGGYR